MGYERTAVDRYLHLKHNSIMQRRKFIAAAAALPFTAVAATANNPLAEGDRQLIELRTYEIKFGGSGKGRLLDYLLEVLAPTLRRMGCPWVKVLKERGDADPAKIWCMIAYPDATTYVKAQDLSGNVDFRTASADYDALGPEKPIFNRYTSSLLLAFTGMPQVTDSREAALYELRTYEGYSEDATRRKIAMFNDEEIPLFHQTGLHPVFFGDMIAGPYRPSLVYMLHFKDMEERNANWKTFVDSPEWKEMAAKPKYANSVSNIRKVFLDPIG